MRLILLDSRPLGLISDPENTAHTADIKAWANTVTDEATYLIVPEIVDFELRRELLRSGMAAGVQRLGQAAEDNAYLPLNTAPMRRAAQLWALTRRAGLPTADPHALDCDVILAAQAQLLAEAGVDVVVATANVSHLSRFVTAALWQDIH